MPNSPRMQWPYPAENKNPWYESFEGLVAAMDASAYAAREDRQLLLAGGGTVYWNSAASTLQWDDTIRVVSPITGFASQVAAGSVSIVDGESLYLSIIRAPTRNVTIEVVVAAQVPSSDRALVLCSRIGTQIYWRNGLLQDAGESVSDLGAKQGGGGGSPLGVEEEGVAIEANCTTMNFVGGNITASSVGPGSVKVEVSGVGQWARNGAGFVYLNTASDDVYIGGSTPNAVLFDSGDAVFGGATMSGGGETVRIVGDARIEGKLTVTGLVDPTGFMLERLTSAPTTPAIDESLIWFDDAGG